MPTLADELVVARAAVEAVGAVAAVELIGGGAAAEQVVARAAEQLVARAGAAQAVLLRRSLDVVGALVAAAIGAEGGGQARREQYAERQEGEQGARSCAEVPIHGRQTYSPHARDELLVVGTGGRSARRRRPARCQRSPGVLTGYSETGIDEVQGGLDDPRLLGDVGGRIALARRRALGPADVAELQPLGQDLHEAREHVRAGAHVARLLLRPDDLLEVRVALDELEDLRLRERIEQLDAADGDARAARRGAGGRRGRSRPCRCTARGA